MKKIGLLFVVVSLFLCLASCKNKQKQETKHFIGAVVLLESKEQKNIDVLSVKYIYQEGIDDDGKYSWVHYYIEYRLKGKTQVRYAVVKYLCEDNIITNHAEKNLTLAEMEMYYNLHEGSADNWKKEQNEAGKKAVLKKGNISSKAIESILKSKPNVTYGNRQ